MIDYENHVEVYRRIFSIPIDILSILTLKCELYARYNRINLSIDLLLWLRQREEDAWHSIQSLSKVIQPYNNATLKLKRCCDANSQRGIEE